MNKNRKGFTIVELVIVIAIIAILAAVLIPTFASLIAKANVSVDTQLVRNLNNALTAEKAGGENNKTMYDALKMTKSAGYDIDTIVSKSGNNIAWDSKNDRFVLVDPKNNTYIYPTESGAGSQTIATPVDFFVIYNEVPALDNQKYSVYLSKNATVATVEVKVGFDAGENTAVRTVNYKNTSAQTVTIRTKGGTLNIDAPSDVVLHYSDVDKVVIKQIADASYHENGKVAVSMEVKDGHVVIEPDAVVKEVVVPNDASADTKVDVKGNSTVNTLVVDSDTAVVEVKENAKVENVVASESNTNVTIPESVGAAKVEKTEVGTAAELQTALNEDKAKYIVFTTDIAVGEWKTTDIIGASITSDVVIDGAGHTLTANAGRAIWIDASNVSVTIKNLKIVGTKAPSGKYVQNGISRITTTERGIQVNNPCQGVKLVMDNIDVSGISHYGININNGVDVDILLTNSKISAWGALNLWSANYTVRVDSSILEGINDKGYDAIGWNNFATVVLEGDTTNKTDNHASVVDVIISNSEIIAKSTQGNKQAAISFHPGSIANRVVLNNTKITLGESNCYSYINNGEGNELIIDGVATSTASIE